MASILPMKSLARRVTQHILTLVVSSATDTISNTESGHLQIQWFSNWILVEQKDEILEVLKMLLAAAMSLWMGNEFHHPALLFFFLSLSLSPLSFVILSLFLLLISHNLVVVSFKCLVCELTIKSTLSHFSQRSWRRFQKTQIREFITGWSRPWRRWRIEQLRRQFTHS